MTQQDAIAAEIGAKPETPDDCPACGYPFLDYAFRTDWVCGSCGASSSDVVLAHAGIAALDREHEGDAS